MKGGVRDGDKGTGGKEVGGKERQEGASSTSTTRPNLFFSRAYIFLWFMRGGGG